MTERIVLWVGVDWGSREHQICVLDSSGQQVAEQVVAHDGAALCALADELERRSAGAPSRVAVAIEQPSGAVVETLLERGMAVYSLNPKQLDRFRDRYTVAGAKDDRRDAFVLAQSLRTDLPLFRPVQPLAPELVELRELVRIREELLKELNGLANRLHEQLQRYFPQLGTLGSVQTCRWVRTLLERAPNPERARRLRHSTVAAILKHHGVRRLAVDEVVVRLRAKPLTVAPGVAEACERHVSMLLPRLKLALAQRDQCERRIAQLLKQRSAASHEDASNEKHRDAAIVLSLPGTGTVVGATVLTEAARLLQDRDYNNLRKRSGVAPVTRQTGLQGKRKGCRPQVVMRRACNPRLRQAVHHMCWAAVRNDERWRQHYERLRSKGHEHAHALRQVGDSMLRMLTAMLRRGELYNPNKRRVHHPESEPAQEHPSVVALPRPSAPTAARVKAAEGARRGEAKRSALTRASTARRCRQANGRGPEKAA